MTHRNDTIICTVHRNGSGQDAGRIDYSINISKLASMAESDREEVVNTAREMLVELGEIMDACTCAVCHTPVEIADGPLRLAGNDHEEPE